MSKKKHKRNKRILAGSGMDVATKASRPVIKGEAVFVMMDSQGLPFDFILDQLAERQISFDVLGFVRAAHASGNFSRKRMRDLLILNQPNQSNYPDFPSLIDTILNSIYGEEDEHR